ncbi:MAG TPA: aspartyl/asparaginyl beta-hydroxylase domain-containing protein [Kofleriaceae bacterium]|nr:aspartyl/asparaginyl beta-hydroxylase domain-containing protein [Kofleriaceae bacterium]
MITALMEDVASLLARGRKAAQSNQLDEALALFRRIVELDPAHAEAHDTLGAIFLHRGDPAAAVRHCEQAVLASPDQIVLHQHLGGAHNQLLRSPRATAELAAICDELPRAFVSRLHLGRLREHAKDDRGALISYTRAVQTAQVHGFWTSETSTPPWLRAQVAHAIAVMRRGRAELFADWMRGAERAHGASEMKRVAKALAMYLGTEPTVYADPRQKPSFLYFPDLPIAPVFPRDALDFADWYEASWEAIRDEALAVHEGIQPFHYDVPEERRAALTRGDWDAYFFYDEGSRIEEHHAACPRTSAILDRLPLDHVRDHGPEWCFSIMRPGAHILPHRGVTNTRSVLHLGLVIPPGCALDLVGVQEVSWEPGRCFAFDDTYEHQAWNRSGETRFVLLGDIWNPYLTPPERLAVADLVATIGDWNRATSAIKPPA